MPIASLQLPPFDAIRCDDVRLRVACPAVAALGPSTVAQLASTADPATLDVLRAAERDLRAWATRTAAATLDDLVDDLLNAWEKTRPANAGYRHPLSPARGVLPPVPPGLREAVAVRLGLRGDPPATLQAATHGRAWSTERVRQVALRFEAAVTSWLWAPALDDALHLGADPVDRDEYAHAVHARGLARKPWYPEAINALARLAGRRQQIVWHPDPDPSLLIDVADRTLRSRHLDIASVSDIAAAAAEEHGRTVKPELVVAALAGGPRGLAVAGNWVWRPGGNHKPSRVVRVAQGMLAIASNLSVTTIHQGWSRRLRGHGVVDVPPVEALTVILHAHGDFRVDRPRGDCPARVRLARRLRPQQVYRGAAIVLIDAIRAAPGQVVTRADLKRAAADVGIGGDTVSAYLSYHEAFVQYAPTLWTLVGVEVDPGAPTQNAPHETAAAAHRVPGR